MRPAVSRRLDELFRLDDLVEFRIARVRLGVDDVDATKWCNSSPGVVRWRLPTIFE